MIHPSTSTLNVQGNLSEEKLKQNVKVNFLNSLLNSVQKEDKKNSSLPIKARS